MIGYLFILCWFAWGAAFFYAASVRCVLYHLPLRDFVSSFAMGTLISAMAIGTIYGWTNPRGE